MQKRKVEVFTAGCPVCEPLVRTVKALACPDCEISVLDTHGDGGRVALGYGVKTLPAVVIDGRVVDCCASPGPSADDLRGAGLGQPLRR